MAKRTKGKCKYCGKEYTFSYMNKHLPVCEERQKKWAEETGGKKTGYFELAIYPKYNREHWLYVEIKETALLKDLDQFLRDIWLECCGHLSAFDINGVRYDVMPQDDFFWGEPAKSMNYKLKSVLEKGMTFGYEYDFGSTTELMITVVNYWIRSNRKEKLIILSRNNPVETLCEECGKNRRCIYAHNAIMREAVGCVKIVRRLMSVERKCFCRSAIRRGWESAAIAEVIFIQSSLYRIYKNYICNCMEALEGPEENR